MCIQHIMTHLFKPRSIIYYCHSRYARFVTRYPYVLLILDIVVVLVCAPLAYVLHGAPDWSDPNKVITTGLPVFHRMHD